MRKLQLDEIVAAVILGMMALIAFVNVLSRYLLHLSLAAIEEIEINLFVWITIIGIGIAYRRGAHLRMTSLLDVLGPGFKRFSILFSGVLGFGVFAFLIYNSAREIHRNVTFYHATSEALGIPTWIYSIGTPIFSLLVLVNIVSSTVAALKGPADDAGVSVV
jgi:TRAP-type C4-dicarboxylate transport system permease small subunit